MAATTSARGAGRRQALLDATLRVAARDGAAAVSHRAVAAEAGVPLGSTTYYFASKDEMLVEALRHAAEEETRRLRERLDALGDVRRPSSRRWVAATVEWATEQLEPGRRPALLARYALQLEAVHRPELRAVYAAWTVATVGLAEALLRAAGGPDPRRDAPVLVAAVDGLLLNQLLLGEDLDLVQRVVRRTMQRLIAP